MLWPLLLMAIATKFLFAASLLSRARVDLLELEAGKDWARQNRAGRGRRMNEFLSMGGYGAYVWSAIAIFVVTLADRRRRAAAQASPRAARTARPRAPRAEKRSEENA